MREGLMTVVPVERKIQHSTTFGRSTGYAPSFEYDGDPEPISKIFEDNLDDSEINTYLCAISSNTTPHHTYDNGGKAEKLIQ